VTPFYGTRPDLVAKMMHQMAAFWRTDVIQAAERMAASVKVFRCRPFTNGAACSGGRRRKTPSRLRLVGREERKQVEGETDGYLGNVG
jgi:hypothetical protein